MVRYDPWQDRVKPNITTLAQLKTALKEFTEDYLQSKFSWSSVEDMIQNILQRNVENIVCAAMGFEKDSFSNGWKLRYDSKESLHSTIRNIAKMKVEEVFPGFAAEWNEKLDRLLHTKEIKDNIRRRYEAEFQDCLRKKIDDWVQEKASLDVENLFALKGEEMLEEVRLKNPLNLNALKELAK